MNAALSWKPQTGTRIDFGLDYSKQVYGADYGIPALGNKPAPVPLHQSYMQNYIDSKTEAILGRAKLSQKLDDAWRVEAGIMASYLKPSYLDVYGFGLDETTLKYPVFYTSEQYSWRRTIQGNVACGHCYPG